MNLLAIHFDVVRFRFEKSIPQQLAVHHHQETISGQKIR